MKEAPCGWNTSGEGALLLTQSERARPLGLSYNVAPSLEENPSASLRTPMLLVLTGPSVFLENERMEVLFQTFKFREGTPS